MPTSLPLSLWCSHAPPISPALSLKLALFLLNLSPSPPPPTQWPEVSDFVARFCTLRESENTQTCENRTQNSQKTHGHARIARENTRTCESSTQNSCDSRMSVCFLTCATCKKVTLIIYLRPLLISPPNPHYMAFAKKQKRNFCTIFTYSVLKEQVIDLRV